MIEKLKTKYKSKQSTFKNSSTLPIILVNSVPFIILAIILMIHVLYGLLTYNTWEGITYVLYVIATVLLWAAVFTVLIIGRTTIITALNLVAIKSCSNSFDMIVAWLLNIFYEAFEINTICSITGIGVQRRMSTAFSGDALSTKEFIIAVTLIATGLVFVVINTILVARNKIQKQPQLENSSESENESVNKSVKKSKIIHKVKMTLAVICAIATLIIPYTYYRMYSLYSYLPDGTIYGALKEYVQDSIETKICNKNTVKEFHKYDSDEYVVESLKERYPKSAFRVVSRSYSDNNSYKSAELFTFEMEGWKSNDSSTVYNFTLTVEMEKSDKYDDIYTIDSNDDYFLIESDNFQLYKDELISLAGNDFTDIEMTGYYLYNDSVGSYKIVEFKLTYYTDYTNEDDFNTAFWEGNKDYQKYRDLAQSFAEIWDEDEDDVEYKLTITAINKDTGEVINTKERVQYIFSATDISDQKNEDRSLGNNDFRTITDGMTIY
jgi:hypothetical protein